MDYRQDSCQMQHNTSNQRYSEAETSLHSTGNAGAYGAGDDDGSENITYTFNREIQPGSKSFKEREICHHAGSRDEGGKQQGYPGAVIL